MASKTRSRAAAAYLALHALGCGAAETDLLGSQTSAIVGGDESGKEDDAVVDLYAGTGFEAAHCTGTLIAPNVVLTALHCVAHFDQYTSFTCSPDGTLTTPAPGGVLGAPLAPDSISVHLGAAYKSQPDAHATLVFGSGSTQICRHDIALLVLDRELEAPPVSLRLDRRTRRGERLRVVGYGVNGTQNVHRYARPAVRITDVGEDAEHGAEGTAAPYTFVTSEGACQGDSGGPAFSEQTGALVGVYSISAATSCTAVGVRNVYTQVAPFEDLIRQALEAAGHSARLEPDEPVDAGDAAATDDADEGAKGSGSRRDPSLACNVPPASGGHAGHAALGAALALCGLLRRVRSSRRRA